VGHQGVQGVGRASLIDFFLDLSKRQPSCSRPSHISKRVAPDRHIFAIMVVIGSGEKAESVMNTLFGRPVNETWPSDTIRVAGAQMLPDSPAFTVRKHLGNENTNPD